jgi:plastocyanin
MMKFRASLTLALMLALTACGSDEGGGGGDPGVVEIIKWTPSGDNQVDTAGQTLPLVIRVKVTVDDAVSAGHTVNFTGTGSFGTPTVVTGANGIATTTWTLPPEAGVIHATATLAGAVGSPITFTATGIPGAPAEMVKIDGDNQSTVRGEIFNAPFVIQVVDANGNGVPDLTVNWSVDGPADLLTATSPTDALGFGRGYLTAHDTLAEVTLTATVAGVAGSPQTFSGSIIGATSTINVQNNYYEPNALTIQAGGAVKWVLVGTGHTITSTGGGVIQNSGVLTTGNVWGPFVFDTPGV